MHRNTFQILVSLADRDCHGYSILRDIEERTGDVRSITPSTLYSSIHRLLQNGLIEELADPVDWILGGWQAAGILNLLSGQPFTALVSTDISNTGTGNPTGGTSNRNHPNRIGSGNLPSDQRSISRWFDVSAFPVPTQYTYGNSGRDVLYGPPVNNLDLKIGKNFQLAERMRLEFRCEMFNASNTPHFNLPAANVNLPTAGIITGAGAPRQIQFGLKFVY